MSGALKPFTRPASIALGALVSGGLRLPPDLGGHWARTLHPRVAACARALLARRGDPDAPAFVILVPGRIEVLGKHTDYAGGRSLLAAAERGFVFVGVPGGRAELRLAALDAGEEGSFALDPALPAERGWRNYPATLARRLARDLPGIGAGADLAFTSDLPAAAGMSSSSALLVGSFLCLAAAGSLEPDARLEETLAEPEQLAAYLAAIESGAGFGPFPGDVGVGTHGGSEDHTAILGALPGQLLQYRFVPPVRDRSVPLPAGYRFAIASSGINAEKAGAMRDRYNRASALARALRELLAEEQGRELPSLLGALRERPREVDRLRTALESRASLPFPAGELRMRLDQLVEESEVIVPAAAEALAAGDLARFGSLVERSQTLAETHLGNQIPETSALVRSARSLGAIAASAFGAGYGGSVWALVQAERADAFLAAWRGTATHPGAAFFLTGAGPGARRIA